MLVRGILVALLYGSISLAAPPLTKIQDVLYKADGTRFSGIAIISWKTFEASDTSNITTQSITVRIMDGNLGVELVPNSGTTPALPYLVKYNSDGKAQFEESWVVPPSTKPLRVRDVRVAAVTAPVEGGTLTTPIEESDVTGLVADLQTRPTKGPGFLPGRAAYINANGGLEAVPGDAADCVRVDGSSGPCGATDTVPGFIDAETPSGVVDGANATFGLAAIPSPSSSLALYRNGILQKIDQDFYLSGSVVAFLAATIPQPGDTLLASYRIGAAQSGSLMAGGPEVLCSETGSATNAQVLTALGSCVIPARTLSTGDRLEIRFDYSHEGASTEFTVAVRYGQATVVSRTVPAGEQLLTGRAEAAVYDSGMQVSSQTWGTLLGAMSTLVAGSYSLDSDLSIDFLAGLAQATAETVTLRNFTVIRYSK